MSTALTQIGIAQKALMEAKTLDDVKDIRDKAEAIRIYTKQQGGYLGKQNDFAELKIQAERKLGGTLKETVRGQGKRDETYHDDTFEPKLEDVGISRNQSSRWQKVAEVPEEKLEEHMASMREGGGEITTNGVLRLANSLRRDEKARGLESSPLPTGTFRVIYVDPPWSYGNSGVIGADSDHYGSPKRHYPTMPTKEICEMEVRDRAADNSVLFLWTTSPLLEESFNVINAWGFKYKSSFVWHKLRHNFAHYNSMRHEFLLISTRGSCVPDSKELVPSVVEIDRGEHSRKPDQFREMIDLLYVPPQKGSDRLELFARGDLPEHWTAWGNEAGK